MLNTLVALVSMSVTHVETWMVRDLRITQVQINHVIYSAFSAHIKEKAEKHLKRSQEHLDLADATLRQAAADREAEARKAEENEAVRRGNRVD